MDLNMKLNVATIVITLLGALWLYLWVRKTNKDNFVRDRREGYVDED